MNRCVANNYSFEAFWRSWHRSFNQWLIRYLFIPLGGSKRKFLNIWVVFGFVAIWHEMNLNLILWAWGICIIMMPEMGIKFFFYQKPVRLGVTVIELTFFFSKDFYGIKCGSSTWQQLPVLSSLLA